MSKSLSVLRAAANQVAQEEHQEGLDGMLKAADEIASERGLSSPLRRSPNRGENGGKENLEISNGQNDRFSPRAISSTKEPVEEAEIDALVFLKQMNIEPKISATVGFADDVQALLDHSEKTLDTNSKTVPAPSNNTRISALRQRYRDKMGRLTNRSVNSSVTTLRGMSLNSEPAEVAQLLSLADDKPYGENIRRSFRTEIEEILFRSTYLIQRPQSAGRQSVGSSGSLDSRKRYEKMRRAADRLSAAPRKEPVWQRSADKTLQYLTLEEAQECTFRPHLRSSAQKKSSREHRDDDGAKEDPRFSFISRQEAEERNRREELQFKIGKQDYDALVDKKVCPQCGAKQSYDEVKEKRKLCVNCRVEYTNPLTWAKVRSKFWKKCQEFSKRVAQHKQEILDELEREFKFVTKKVVDERGKVVDVQVPRSHVLTDEEEQEFFRRIEEKLAEKEANVKRLERELYDEKYTFKPTVKQYKSANQDSDDDISNGYSDDEKNVVQAFLHRYEEDMDYRREKMPQKYLKIRRKTHDADAIAPFKV